MQHHLRIIIIIIIIIVIADLYKWDTFKQPSPEALTPACDKSMGPPPNVRLVSWYVT
jgi:hypothetical protein